MDEAETVLGLCDRFHKLPSEIEAEDARLLRLIKITAAARGEGVTSG